MQMEVIDIQCNSNLNSGIAVVEYNRIAAEILRTWRT